MDNLGACIRIIKISLVLFFLPNCIGLILLYSVFWLWTVWGLAQKQYKWNNTIFVSCKVFWCFQKIVVLKFFSLKTFFAWKFFGDSNLFLSIENFSILKKNWKKNCFHFFKSSYIKWNCIALLFFQNGSHVFNPTF